MKLISGAVLLAAAEQAYSHAQLIPFPHHEAAAQLLVPASGLLVLLGSLLLLWGLLTETWSNQPRPAQAPIDPTHYR